MAVSDTNATVRIRVMTEEILVDKAFAEAAESM